MRGCDEVLTHSRLVLRGHSGVRNADPVYQWWLESRDFRYCTSGNMTDPLLGGGGVKFDGRARLVWTECLCLCLRHVGKTSKHKAAYSLLNFDCYLTKPPSNIAQR